MLQNLKIFVVRHKKGLVVVIAIAIATLVASNYSVLVVSLPDDQSRSVYIKRIGDEDGATKHDFSTKKTFILKKGNYSVEINNQNNQSVYYTTQGRFDYNKLSMEFASQKSLGFASKSPYRCSYKLPGDNASMFLYSCQYIPQSSGVDLIDSQGNENKLIDLDYLDEYTPSGDVSLNSGLSIKPFGRSVAVFVSDSKNNLAMLEITEDKRVSQLKVFDGIKINDSVNDSTIDVNSKGDVAHLDKNLVKYVAKDGNRKTFEIKDLEQKSDQVSTLLLSDSVAFVVISPDRSLYSGIIHEDEEETVPKPSSPTFVYSISLENGETKDKKLSGGFVASEILKQSDKLLITPVDTATPSLLVNHGGVENFNIPTEEIYLPCIVDDKEMYFTSKDKQMVYRYSFSKKSAFLVYFSESNLVDDTYCGIGGLSFTSYDVGDGLYSHLYLSDEDLGNSIRVSEFLPMTHTFRGDTYNLSLSGQNNVIVETLYDSTGDGRSADNILTNEFNSIFFDKGVDIDRLRYIFK